MACTSALAEGAPSLQSRLDSAQGTVDANRSREAALSRDVAAFSGLIGRLRGEVGTLQAREDAVQSDLETKRAELERIESELARQRRWLTRLQTKLRFSRRVLARRLVQIYQQGRPDVIGVILNSRGFVDLLEREEFIRRINRQDVTIVTRVGRDRDAAEGAATRLGDLEARQQQATAVVQARRDQVAGMKQWLVAKQSAYAQAQAQQASALQVVRSDRRHAQGTVDSLQARLRAAQASDFAPSPGSGSGSWSIPWSIVRCESGGRNTGPNHIGASGYYQIIPDTWRGAGGRGPAAHLAPKSEQDRIAAQLWANGRGRGNWVC